MTVSPYPSSPIARHIALALSLTEVAPPAVAVALGLASVLALASALALASTLTLASALALDIPHPMPKVDLDLPEAVKLHKNDPEVTVRVVVMVQGAGVTV